MILLVPYIANSALLRTAVPYFEVYRLRILDCGYWKKAWVQ